MKRNICTIALLAGILFAACAKKAEKQPGQIEKAAWLIGSWENKSEFGTMSENWEKMNDSVYHGTSYFIKDKDTLHSESVELSQKGSDLIYSPNVKGQNSDLPVAFKMTSATANQLVFENPAHDFPQKITYKMITKDSLVAEISGKQGGKPASEAYPMGRKKQP